ncbi:MAG TPA: hypothetical protein PLG50_00440 [bacterium]|nr:hypothetical protein [bacterium]HQG44108.1 hypothetical protein [bacterium]HQI47479.1 hypothetical protein [bacterium]HQJ65318.1 hypothetical protein [bacterium]
MPDETTVIDPTQTSALESLIEIFKQANNPDLFEAQNIILRRLALQGDVVGSRVPAPQNITEIGGYLNLLRDMKEREMQAQVLAGILGVAGPNPPLGWASKQPPLVMVALPNDRPEGSAQSAIPLSFVVRSDFSQSLRAGLKTLHDRGCALPLMASALPLPPASALPITSTDTYLPHLGRLLEVVPAAALVNPTADILALVRPAGTTEGFQIAARVLADGPVTVPPADWDAIQCDSTSSQTVTITGGKFVPIASALALAGFYPSTPLPQPTSLLATEWTRLTNCTGLVAGRTRLGDELSLLHNPLEIATSAFAPMLDWIWDGITFIKP